MAKPAFVAAALIAALAGCSTQNSPPLGRPKGTCLLVENGYGPAGSVPIRVETVVSGLEVPWGIAFLPDGDWLVTERPGRVRLVTGGVLIPDPVVTVDVLHDEEGGLLGIAVSPHFEQDRFFYVYATVADPDRHNRVVRYKLSDNRRSAALDKIILDRIPGAQYHDGGRLRFGPDGMLYIGTGDARQPQLAQDPKSLAGKLLRVAPDGSIPVDNPFPGNAVFLTGIRNTQGFDWVTPKLLAVTDHGPSGELGRSGHDELNIAIAGLNLGWPNIYGCESGDRMVTPSLTWEEAVPPGGAAIYTDGKIPEWNGSLLIGTLKSKHLHRVVFNKGDPRKIVLQETYLQGDPPTGYGRLRDVVMGSDGDVYVTTSNCDRRGTCPADKDKVLRVTR